MAKKQPRPAKKAVKPVKCWIIKRKNIPGFLIVLNADTASAWRVLIGTVVIPCLIVPADGTYTVTLAGRGSK